MKILHTDVAVLTERLFTLERCGRYEEALAEVRCIWEDTTTFPQVDELASRPAAEILLRCGAVIGFLGHIKQIPNSQEKSKNLLTEARHRFLDIYDLEKIAECENYLALAYWRTGEFIEAETWINEALSHAIGRESDVWLYSNLTKSLICLSTSKFEEIVSELTSAEIYFRQNGNDFLNGCFCSNISIAFRNLGHLPAAMEYLERARGHHQKSGHRIYLGTVENNLAYLYKALGRFDESHQAVDNAIEIYQRLNDCTREGFVLDTKAIIYCDQGKYAEAFETIEKALEILRKSENAGYLVETCLTKSKILLYLDDFTEAFLCLSDAVQTARAKISEEAAKNLVKEFETTLAQKRSPVMTEAFSEKPIPSENLELVLPPSLSHYHEFQGVWLKNSYLENVGLPKGSLAIVTKDKITRGDLVAITEVSTEAVLCGFYDSEFGIVCLEGIGPEPMLFDENDIKILGRIVGVGKKPQGTDRKIQIEAVKL